MYSHGVSGQMNLPPKPRQDFFSVGRALPVKYAALSFSLFRLLVNKLPVLFLPLLLLSACTVGQNFVRPSLPEAKWHAPLPHGGKVDNLAHWWEQMHDPLLTQLILSAEKNSPTLDMALARVNEARSNVESSDAPRHVQAGITGSVTRSKSVFGALSVMQTSVRTGFDAGWELDLFGGRQRGAEAAQARLDAADTGWHEARISLAAEVADSYVELRACEASRTLADKMLSSRSTTRELFESKQKNGFASASDAARQHAAQIEAAAVLATKQGDCARLVNRLVALSGMPQPALLQAILERTGQMPEVSEIAVDSLAANALRQRPDVAGAEFNLAAASADTGVAEAASYPSLTLIGSVGRSRVQGNVASNASTWSFSPGIYIPPFFDGGKRTADQHASQARYDYALASYQKTVRDAVHEIEDALLRLDVATQRVAHSREALTQYQTMQQSVAARQRVGMASQLDNEEASRTLWQAQDALLATQRENVAAWIAVYKALGGGWASGGVER